MPAGMIGNIIYLKKNKSSYESVPKYKTDKTKTRPFKLLLLLLIIA
jgi:hypothetical protein